MTGDYIHTYYLYRNGNPSEISEAYVSAFDHHDEFDWEPPFLRTIFGNVTLGCEDIAAEMVGMDSVANQKYEDEGEKWDLFDSPLGVFFLKDEQYFEGGGDHPFGAAEGEPVATFAEMVKTGYLATGERPLAAHAQPPMIRGYIDANDSPPFTAESLAHDEYEYLSWITIFTPAVVETYGRETLLSAPAWKVEELDDGAIMIVAYEDPHDPEPENYPAVADHIGLKKYYRR